MVQKEVTTSTIFMHESIPAHEANRKPPKRNHCPLPAHLFQTHIISDKVRARSRNSQHGHVRKLPLEDAQLTVFRTEVVAPLKRAIKSDSND